MEAKKTWLFLDLVVIFIIFWATSVILEHWRAFSHFAIDWCVLLFGLATIGAGVWQSSREGGWIRIAVTAVVVVLLAMWATHFTSSRLTLEDLRRGLEQRGRE